MFSSQFNSVGVTCPEPTESCRRLTPEAIKLNDHLGTAIYSTIALIYALASRRQTFEDHLIPTSNKGKIKKAERRRGTPRESSITLLWRLISLIIVGGHFHS